MRTDIASLPTPDQAGFSDKTLKTLRGLASHREDARAVQKAVGDEEGAYDTDLHQHLSKNSYVNKARLSDEVMTELLKAGYISVPEDKKFADAGLFINHYANVHPYAIITGSEGATHEVTITAGGYGGMVIGFLRTTHVDFSNGSGNRGLDICRMRLRTDGVDEEHDSSFISELEVVGNLVHVGFSGDFTMEAMIASISGYPLGNVPLREKHECMRVNPDECDVKYNMEYIPSHDSHDPRHLPPTGKELKLLDVFRGSVVEITVRPVAAGAEA